MIDLVNTQYLTDDQRRSSLARALHSQPFFNLLDFQLIAAAANIFQYGAKAQVDKDFYVTDVKGNFSEVVDLTGAFYEMSLYISGTGQSLYRYIPNELVPTPFQCTDVLKFTFFDDRQRELMPTLVKRGDNLIGQIKNTTAKLHIAHPQIVVAGYYPIGESYLSPRADEGIKESLAKDIEIELWSFDVLDADVATDFATRIFNNDRFARIVLGFGLVDKDIELLTRGNVLITDAYRNIKLNNDPIGIQFFAPEMPVTHDAHIYYLPIEHFWEPFAPLKFDFSALDFNEGAGFEFVMLTRTV